MQNELKQYLRYEPETGNFYWIKKSGDKTIVGSRAGWMRSKNGYRQIGFRGNIYYEHRLAWIFQHGDIYAAEYRRELKL